MPRPRRFSQVDVFSEQPMGGNPVAVVVDGSDLGEGGMRALARWTNLSETTFLLPPTDPAADYRVRIFTPGGELAFAGHPTLGSAHAWLEAGGVAASSGTVVQECGVGAVALRSSGGRLAFAAPPCRSTDLDGSRLAALRAALGLTEADVVDARQLDNGAPWSTLRLTDAATVLALRPDGRALVGRGEVAVVGPHPPGGPAAFELRAFAVDQGIEEDPVTGSLNAAVAQWLVPDGVAPASYVAAQGTAMGRTGRIHIDVVGGTTWVGGATHTVVQGTATL